MAFPGFSTTPIYAPGLTIPCPVYDNLWWLVGLAEPSEDVQFSGLPSIVRTVDTEGGSVDFMVVGGGSQAQITMTSVWDVVLVDRLEVPDADGFSPFEGCGEAPATGWEECP